MIGQKGLPATWGGIEHHVEEVGARLVRRGHEVIVYCRAHYSTATTAEHRGMQLVPVWSANTKHLDAVSHSAACTVRALRDRVDIIHYHAVGPGLLAPLPRYLSRTKVVLTVHGLDGQRDKWNGAAKIVLQSAEKMSSFVPHETVVVSKALRSHYASRYGRATTWITNGVDAPAAFSAKPVTAPFGLESKSYVLFVGRFVPEKLPDVLIKAFADVTHDVRLVLAGGSSFSDDYSGRLRAAADRDARVLLPGYVHGQALADLYAGAACFVLPSAVEGLPLTLLEAASHGLPVIVSDIAPNVEVVGVDGPGRRVVPVGDVAALTAALTAVLDSLSRERLGAVALRDEVLEQYQWDHVTDELEQVYARVMSRRSSGLVG